MAELVLDKPGEDLGQRLPAESLRSPHGRAGKTGDAIDSTLGIDEDELFGTTSIFATGEALLQVRRVSTIVEQVIFEFHHQILHRPRFGKVQGGQRIFEEGVNLGVGTSFRDQLAHKFDEIKGGGESPQILIQAMSPVSEARLLDPHQRTGIEEAQPNDVQRFQDRTETFLAFPTVAGNPMKTTVVRRQKIDPEVALADRPDAENDRLGLEFLASAGSHEGNLSG